jgi:phosphoribosylglycinamide formyltransferase-1
MAGRWVVRTAGVTRLRHVGYVAIALAFPYALLAGAIAVASRTAVASPSLWQAVIAAFLLALVAGGLGAARGLAPWSRLTTLMPPRHRSIVMGMLATGTVLTAAGAILAGGSLVTHLQQVRQATDALNPGPGGAALLLLAQLAYIPNAIIWAVAYTLGPGFAFGTGTVVAPTGSALGAVPIFPMLSALPSGNTAQSVATAGYGGSHLGGSVWLTIAMLAVPYLAGIFGGIVTVRIAPTPMLEAAPLWGFAAGTAAGLVTGLAAVFAGGPLGDGRLAAVGPSGIQVGLVAVLEIGVTAALAAGAANWLILRRAANRSPVPGGIPDPSVVDESDDLDGHRIFVNPWAEEPAELRHAYLPPGRLLQLGRAGLLSRDRVRAVHAREIRVQLRPVHRERGQQHYPEPGTDHAEQHAAESPGGPPGSVPSRLAVRGRAEPDRHHAEHDDEPDHQQCLFRIVGGRHRQQAQRADQECRHGPLSYFFGSGRQRHPLPGCRSGHRVLLSPVSRLSWPSLYRCRMGARLVVLVSGEGTNLQALIEAAQDPGYGASVVAVGADRTGINGLKRAEQRGIPTFTVRVKDHETRLDWDEALASVCADFQPDLIVSAGFMKLVGGPFLAAFGGRFINTHPALLPSFPGMHGARDALAYGVKVTGATLFIVDEGVDAGPIVAQASVPVHDDDDENTLHERIKVAERALLTDTVGRMVREGWSVTGRKVRIGA